jgi:hypothetical protein
VNSISTSIFFLSFDLMFVVVYFYPWFVLKTSFYGYQCTSLLSIIVFNLVLDMFLNLLMAIN